MKKLAYLLDLDDTLYCEHDFVRSGFREVAHYLANESNFSNEQIFKEIIKVWHNHGRGKVFDVVCEKFSIQVDIQILLKVYRRHQPEIKLYDDAIQFLKYAKDNQIKLGIITDGNTETQWRKIEALGLKTLVDIIIVSDDLGGFEYWKPSEVPYQRAAELLGEQIKECCYIGDNPNKDFITARKLGMKTIRIIRNIGDHMETKLAEEFEADQIIYSLNELINDRG